MPDIATLVQAGAVGMFFGFLVLIGVLAKLIAPIIQKTIDLFSNHVTELSRIIDERLGAMTKSMDELKDSIDKWQDKEHPTA